MKHLKQMSSKIKVGSDFSGVGAFNQALIRLGIDYEEVFACDMDKYARQTFIHNYGEPSYYPENVYDRIIPEDSLDIFMTSPPCQAFSLAGKRKGEDDKRGVLFYNSHEFIIKNKPRYFIFENVKGLLSDDGGKTFNRWLDMLGGKSVNGNPVLFPREDSAPYHIYHRVLNAKDYGVPQNRERVFIIGIRDDEDNNFHWPKKQRLVKRLKDVLEDDVDEKYYLSDKIIKSLSSCNNEFQGRFVPKEEGDIGNCLTARYYKMGKTDNYMKELKKSNVLKVKSATKKGYEIAIEGDSIKLSNPNSETRRGRVGKDVAQTLDTACNQAVVIGAIRGRNPENPLSREVGLPTEQRLELNNNGISNALTTVQKDNVVVENNLFNTKKSSIFNGNLNKYERNTIKTLSLLQKEIGTKEIESWGLRIMETIREKEILQSRLYEASIQRKTKETSKRNINKIQQSKSKKIIAQIIMRSLSKEKWERCSPQRRKSIKQLIRQLNESLQVLPSENPQTKTNLQVRELQYKSEGVRLLREALSKIQKIWKPFDVKEEPIQQNYRIRRLSVRECFRLMDFPDTFTWPVSNSQAYKQAGNSIVVNVLAEIIGKFKL